MYMFVSNSGKCKYLLRTWMHVNTTFSYLLISRDRYHVCVLTVRLFTFISSLSFKWIVSFNSLGLEKIIFHHISSAPINSLNNRV